MIQVISKIFKIMEILNENGELSLGEIAQITKLNKGTLCNILRSISDCGYIERTQHGRYILSGKLSSFGNSAHLNEEECSILTKGIFDLAEQLGESTVAGMLSGCRIKIIAQAQPERELMINQGIIYRNLSLYHSVTGRILLAFSTSEKRRSCFNTCGAPAEKWDNIQDFETLEDACGKIRAAGISIMENRNSGIKSFAVPVLRRNGDIVAALGLTMPISRAADYGSNIETTLCATAKNLTLLIKGQQ